MAIVQPAFDPFSAHFQDPGAAMGRLGDDPHLGPRHRCCGHAFGLKGHREQGNRDLLTGGQQHVHFPLGGIGIEGAGQGCELISGVAHRGDHHHQVIAIEARCSNALGNGLDALHAAHGGAPVFLNQQRH